MSIQSQIDRLQAAKADLIAKIEAKGVSVPGDASLDDLAALVQAIDTQEDLSAEMTQQDSLIEDIMVALQGKAAGSGDAPVIRSLSVTENGTYTAPDGVDGYSPVVVEVPEKEPVTQELNVTQNGEYVPGSGVDGYSKVKVNVPDIPPVLDTLEVTENGTYNAPSGIDGYSSVVVDVPAPEVPDPVLQSKTVTPTTSKQTVKPDSGYDGLSQVVVNAIPSKYVDTTAADATADKILDGYSGFVDGVLVNGSMPDNGAISKTMDGLTSKSVTIPEGYTKGGTVSLDDTIDNEVDDQADLIQQITTALQGKAGGGDVETCTVTVNNPDYYGFGWTNGEQNFVEYDFLSEQMQIKVVKGSVLIAYYGSGFSVSGNIFDWAMTNEVVAFVVNGNGAITLK